MYESIINPIRGVESAKKSKGVASPILLLTIGIFCLFLSFFVMTGAWNLDGVEYRTIGFIAFWLVLILMVSGLATTLTMNIFGSRGSFAAGLKTVSIPTYVFGVGMLIASLFSLLKFDQWFNGANYEILIYFMASASFMASVVRLIIFAIAYALSIRLIMVLFKADFIKAFVAGNIIASVTFLALYFTLFEMMMGAMGVMGPSALI